MIRLRIRGRAARQLGSSPKGTDADRVRDLERWLFELLSLQEETARDLKNAQTLEEEDIPRIVAFVELLINPASYRARTVETISLDGRRIKQRVSVEYSLPDFERVLPGGTDLHNGEEGQATRPDISALYVPILRPLKGELLDNFALSSASGSTLTDLSYEETLRLLSVALHALLLACFDEDSGHAIHEASSAETLLLGIISKRGNMTTEQAMEQTAKALSLLGSQISHKRDAERQRLEKFVLALGPAYPIVAVVPVEQDTKRVLIRYELTIISTPLSKSFKDWLRLQLGLRPYQVSIPVDLALLSGSYHLHVEGPAEQYLMEQYLRCRRCEKLAPKRPPYWQGKATTLHSSTDDDCSHQDSEAEPIYYFRLRRKWGQNYAHLYMRGYSNSGLRRIQLLVRFGETPPGTLASAAVTAGAATILIGVVGGLVSNGGSTAGGIPALFLAFPIAAASWFGYASDSESVLRASLAARISLISSGVLCFVAAGVYLLGVDTKDFLVQHGLNLLGVREPLWVGLVILAAMNLFYILIEYFVRTAYYNTLLRRSESEYGHGG
jgi:hypothetical protein